MRVLAILGLLLTFSLPVHSAILEFDGVQNSGVINSSYAEDSVTVSGIGGSVAFNQNPGKVHLTDYGTAFAHTISIENGGRFNAVSFDYQDTNRNCISYLCAIIIPYNNIELSAFREGSLIGTEFLTGNGVPTTHLFSSDFMDIDKLVISVLSPFFDPTPYCLTTGEPCSVVEVDNLVLNPIEISQVPLPAGLPLYAAGMALMGLWMRQRRAKQN